MSVFDDYDYDFCDDDNKDDDYDYDDSDDNEDDYYDKNSDDNNVNYDCFHHLLHHEISI